MRVDGGSPTKRGWGWAASKRLPVAGMFKAGQLRVAASFVLVVTAYSVYSLAAVPFIEPEYKAESHEEITQEERDKAGKIVANQRADLNRWFKDGDWELTSPKVIETPQGKLLLKEYEPDPKDRHEITLRPCTMILFPEGQFENEEERQRRAVVLRSPDGATLRFAEEIDLSAFRVGSKIVAANMPGKITIRSDQRSPGPEDDLLLLTQHVTLDNDVISTPHLVEFFYGPNQGRGREMRLALTTAAEKAAQPTLPAAKAFELARDVYMRMESADVELMPGGQSPPPQEKSGQSGPPKPPVEITCQGAFQFDLRTYVATFHKHVDVLRLNRELPSDQLTCERLAIHFEQDPTAASAEPGEGKSSTPKLRPRRIIADGNPVKLDARASGVEARGRRLEYDVQNRSGKLFDNDEALLRQTDPATRQLREIHARELEFESDPASPSGPPRRIDARGEGWLRGTPPANPGQEIYVKWTSRLTFYPFKGSQVLSIRGGAHVEMAAAGALEADEIHLWLQKAPPGAAAPSFGGSPSEGGLVPEKMTALGHVKPSSPQLEGIVRQMNVWFARVEPAPVAAPAPAAAPAADPPPPAPPEPIKKEDRGPPGQRWHVSGDLLNVQARFRAGQTEVTEVTLDGDARCAELPPLTRPDQPPPPSPKPQQPLIITGEQFHLVQPTPETTTVDITGRPARAVAQGMTLEGGSDKATGTIHLNRATNQLWIPGEGALTMPVDQDLEGRKLANPQPLTVVWQGRMDFDGLVAHFQKDVVAYNAEIRLKTPDMQVVFSEPVRFDGRREGARAQLERLICRQGVDLDHQQKQGQHWLSWDRMKANDLTYEYSSGDMEADGPGWITRTWLDDGSASVALPAGAAKKGPAGKPAASPKPRARLLYLHATFDDKMTGNQRREMVTLHRRVEAVYGPVLRWQSTIDPNYRERLGQEGFVLNCDQLLVARESITRDEQSAVELDGSGNILIVGYDFTARARSVHYSSRKDMLVLSGDGRVPASFYRQQKNGSNPTQFSAGRIQYQPKSQDLKIDDFQSLDVKDLQTKQPAGSNGLK
jgi:lipopolysaccharide export system protein LptA